MSQNAERPVRSDVAGIEVEEGNVEQEKLERDAIRCAVDAISSRETMYEIPTTVAGDILLGYLRSASKPISKRAALVLLIEDLQEIAIKLRRRTFTLTINRARGASLLYLAHAVGVDRVARHRELWAALKEQDYEAAHDLVLRMYWTFDVVASRDRVGQERICALARMMRTGELPIKK